MSAERRKLTVPARYMGKIRAGMLDSGNSRETRQSKGSADRQTCDSESLFCFVFLLFFDLG